MRLAYEVCCLWPSEYSRLIILFHKLDATASIDRDLFRQIEDLSLAPNICSSSVHFSVPERWRDFWEWEYWLICSCGLGQRWQGVVL